MDAHYIRPKNWRQDIWELDPENLANNGLQNEDLIVWMRTAALPNFRKLYRRINHKGELQTELPDAKFKFTINYREYYNLESLLATHVHKLILLEHKWKYSVLFFIVIVIKPALRAELPHPIYAWIFQFSFFWIAYHALVVIVSTFQVYSNVEKGKCPLNYRPWLYLIYFFSFRRQIFLRQKVCCPGQHVNLGRQKLIPGNNDSF